VNGFKVVSLIVSHVVSLCYGWVVCGFINGLMSAFVNGV
jgi:hypothetical protein